MAFLLLDSLPTFAQEHARDYYAPRTAKNEIQLYNNVMGHHFNQGQKELADRRYHAALAHYEFILRYYPNQPQVLGLLSELCMKWKSPKCDADGWFQRAIERNPNAAPTYLANGIHLHKNERIKEAAEAYLRAAELAPDSINAHYNLGLVYIDLKQYDLANQHAQKSYQLGASLPGLRNRLERLSKWNTNVSMPASEAKSPSDAKPAGEPLPKAEKTPN